MGKISEIVGVVVDGTLVKNRVEHGEVFYTITVRFCNTEIPVLFSAYVNTTVFENDVKVKVTGCLMSDIRNVKLPKFYFYANKIELEDIDAECTDVINFSCTVTKNKGFGMNSRCEEILSLVGADKTPLGSTSILYLCVKGKSARCLKDKEKGYVIIGKGHLKAYRDIHEIIVTEISNLEQITT